jgi:hypothetical protein
LSKFIAFSPSVEFSASYRHSSGNESNAIEIRASAIPKTSYKVRLSFLPAPLLGKPMLQLMPIAHSQLTVKSGLVDVFSQRLDADQEFDVECEPKAGTYANQS